MAWSYDPLWKLLIDKKIKKSELKTIAGITSQTIANMGKNKPVSLETIGKLCTYFDCHIEDIIEYIPDGEAE